MILFVALIKGEQWRQSATNEEQEPKVTDVQ